MISLYQLFCYFASIGIVAWTKCHFCWGTMSVKSPPHHKLQKVIHLISSKEYDLVHNRLNKNMFSMWSCILNLPTAGNIMEHVCREMAFLCSFPMFLFAFAFINLFSDRIQPHLCVSLSTVWLIWRLWAARRLQVILLHRTNSSQLLMTSHHTYDVLLNIPLTFPWIFL